MGWRLVMIRRSACLPLIMILSLILLTPSVDSNIPPPIERVTTESGGLYSIASNVSMPEAEVNVTISLQESWNYSINVIGSFRIKSQETQNLTTAFVYPSVWTHFTEDQIVTIREFLISVNNSNVAFTVLPFDDFKDDFDFNQTNWENVVDCDFALFNFSIDSEDPIDVGVSTVFSVTTTAHEFIFEYIVDTARGWEGNAHETVSIDFERTPGTEFIEYKFAPEQCLEFIGNNYSANLFWNFNISDFLYDRVSFKVQQRDYPDYDPIPPPPPGPSPWLPLIFWTVVLIIIIGLRKQDKI